MITRTHLDGWVLRMATSAVLATLASGCGTGPETAYGSRRGASLNGTGAFAELLRAQGHQVRSARRLTDELSLWADVIVRFAGTPGPPGRDEAAWYSNWLLQDPGHGLVYVVRDYDAEPEYWERVIAGLTGPEQDDRRADAESRRDRARDWVLRLPNQEDHPADPAFWFAMSPAVEPAVPCKTLGGPWAQGIDATRAAIPLHQAIKVDPDKTTTLLTGDGKVLAAEWESEEGGDVLVLASGSYLLNLPMAIEARRPLAAQVADWMGDGPSRVAFVEGLDAIGEPRGPRTLIELIQDLPAFRWIAVHLGLFALVASVARGVRIGRARPELVPGMGKPSDHAEALGDLLGRSRGGQAAVLDILAAYRRWRSGDARTDRSG